MKIENKAGEQLSPCLTSDLQLNQLVDLPFSVTQVDVLAYILLIDSILLIDMIAPT